MNSVCFSRRKKGFSLVEVILAVGVLSMAILALVGILGGTFQQVDEVVRTNRAIGVVNAVSAAFDSPELIGGDKPVLTDPTKQIGFDVLYEALSVAVTGKTTRFFVFTREIDPDFGSATGGKVKGTMSLVVRTSDDKFTKEYFDKNSGIGPVFRVEVSVCESLLREQNLTIDANGEHTADIYKGGALPSKPDTYGLAYLPLILDIYSYEPRVDTGTTEIPESTPILSQTIVINR